MVIIWISGRGIGMIVSGPCEPSVLTISSTQAAPTSLGTFSTACRAGATTGSSTTLMDGPAA